MKLVGKRGVSGALEIVTVLLMLTALGLMTGLWWLIPYVTGRVPGEAELYFEKYFAVLLFSGLLAECILWNARGILHNVNTQKPFCRDNVRRLRLLGAECLILGALYAVGVFFISRVFMVAVFVTFTVVGLTLLVFAELFHQAVQYKEENESTI